MKTLIVTYSDGNVRASENGFGGIQTTAYDGEGNVSESELSITLEKYLHCLIGNAVAMGVQIVSISFNNFDSAQ